MSKFFLFLARLLFSGLFLFSAYGHFANTKGMAGYAASKGVPSSELGVQVSGAVFGFGALGVLTGWFPRLGAWLIALQLIPISYYMHPFWKEEDAQKKQGEMVNFLKNSSLIGSAILIAELNKAVAKSNKAAKAAN